MAASVGDLAINVFANTATAEQGLNRLADLVGKAGASIQSKFDEVTKSLGKVQSVFAGLGVSLSVAGFAAGIKSSIDYADKLNDLSKTTGIAVETLGGLGYAAKQSGVDLETIAKGLQKMNMQLNDASGNTELLDLFDRMGVKVKDLATGALRPLDQILFDVSNKFKTYKDGPEKAALATELFKKGGEALIPLLNEGGERLRELVAEYERYGGVTTEVAQRSDQFNDTMEKVKLIQGALFREVAANLLPTLQTLANQFVDAKSKGEGFKGFAEGVTTVVKVLASVAIGVAEAFKYLGGNIGAVAAAVGAVLVGDFSRAVDIIRQRNVDIREGFVDAGKRIAEVWNASAATVSVAAGKIESQTTAPVKRSKEQIEGFARALESMQKATREAQERFDNFGKSIEEQTTPSMKKLLDLIFSPQWKTFNQQQQDQLVAEGLRADAIDKSTAALKRLEDETKQYYEIVNKAREEQNAAVDKSLQAIDDFVNGTKEQSDELQFQISLIGKSAEEQEKLIALHRIDIDLQRVLASLGEEASTNDRLRAIAAADLAKSQIAAGLQQKNALAQLQTGWTQVFGALTDIGARFIEDFVQHGSSSFKNLWENFKAWALSTLAKIAAQQVIVRVAALFGAEASGVASNLAGANPLTNLFGLGNAATSGLGNTGILSSIGGFIGGPGGAALGSGVTAGLDTLGIAFSAGADAVGGFTAVLGAAGAVLGPFVPLLALAIPLLSGLFKGEPSPVKGQFGFSSVNTGFEDAVSKQTKFGFAGFLDAATQQFSGQAAQAFNEIVSGALDAFAARMSGEQQDRLSKILQDTTFASFEGTFTTEDFLKQYGGQVLQQVVQAAFDVLNPALAAVVAGFKGTADEVASFSNTLLAINDVTAKFSEEFKSRITEALSDSTQETADKVLAFATIFSNFGGSLSALQPKLEALDPGQIIAFVDALGGAGAALQSQAFIVANFKTSSDRAAEASAALTAAFEDLGVQLPSSSKDIHKWFLDLLSSFDLTTEEGRNLYASISALAPAFISVYGTADNAAGAVNAVSDAFAGLFSFFERFRQTQHLTARRLADKNLRRFSIVFDAARLYYRFESHCESSRNDRDR